ncbi:hypothetical protein PENTCL1PPCAC_23381, partial [Pristionchus entomophagus]
NIMRTLQELQEASHKASCAFESISLGQGQEGSMVEALRRASENGSWLLLNNVHIMLASLPLIQKELATITPKAEFRLWMTTEADDRFPSIILQEALKITFESPPGIRNNMINSYSQLGDSSGRSVLTAQTTFVAVWLHALMQERRSFIPQAWTRYYEFSTADVRMAKAIVETMTQSDAVDWAFIRGLYEFTIYGGRLENDFDSAVLRSYLKRLFNSSKIIGRGGQEVAAGIEIIPASKTEDYVNHIVRVLPSGEDKPELFGLPANIRMAWMRSEAERTITSLRMLDSGSSTSSSTQSSQWASVSNPLLVHWKRLLTGTDLHTRSTEVNVKNGSEPLAQVLGLEFGFSIGVLQQLHQQLTLINRIVKSVVKADKKMEEVLNSLILHQTPDDWQMIWNGPRDPSEYLSTIVYRTKCTQDLYHAADSNQLLLKPVNLAKLLRPKTLLTALRQMTARKQQVEMDTLQLRCSWEASKAPGAIALTVNGLQLQGALFEGNYGSTLKSTNESSASFTSAPSIILAWSSESSIYSDDSSVSVPIYSNSDRSELIATVQMPTDD